MGSTELRRTFGEDPDRYDRARPGYPPALVRDLARAGAIGPGDRVLEIGPGTGQATAALVAAGARVVAVELAPGLAAVLRGKPDLAEVDVVVGAFEEWDPPAPPFDAVVAFTSWHWLDPAARARKVAEALRPGGALVTVTTSHVAGGTVDFFAEVQECYERWDPATPLGLRLEPPDALPAELDEVDESPLFLPGSRRRYTQDVAYSTAAYLDVLLTYSGHRALPPERRSGLLGCVGELIDRSYGGTITKRYLYEVRIARRRRER
ncbi:class I SAM-dependent methyltransferase [Pengzhenrongella sicca]|uniref:Class I SAM-dependent methyltransferase n=1 Tax=Pengzhenrongella sicca TaxID=2819238 RepID=A0A8A4ZKK6_9MICO|nr:class I SAM-dependent methyltransferase [Pengzhenrongella sicca]QTE30118.1 class I SAM-dependent methyltransferase [Pengzhenrongella sicca]